MIYIYIWLIGIKNIASSRDMDYGNNNKNKKMGITAEVHAVSDHK
jgi:hypothetical protein